MNRFSKMILALAGCLLVGVLVLGPILAEEENAADRKERILANLRLAFPRLEKVPVTMGVIGPSGYGGLDEGTFTVNGRPQSFFVAEDDKKLYMLSGEAVDVSRSQEDITAELAQRAAAKAEEAAGRLEEIAAAITNLPYRGAADAPVTIVEFSDFQCPYCSRGAETVEQILEKYPNDVKFVFKHFPLGFHPWAKPAAIASHCGAQQSAEAFWTLHDRYFENQKQITLDNLLQKSKDFLADSDIDMEAWSTCAENTESEEYKAASASVDADVAFGQKLGVSGTPGFFVNGSFLNGAQPIAAFEPLIAAALDTEG